MKLFMCAGQAMSPPVFRIATVVTMLLFMGCGPIRPPKDAYQDAQTLLTQMKEKRSGVSSFRISGAIDHVKEQRVRGKVYIFSKLPHHLRIDVLSPFGTTLSVLTADETAFGLSDYKSNRFFSGSPSPCNVARFVGVALPPEDIVSLLIGDAPLVEGKAEISWHPDGHYIVTIYGKEAVQILHIGADKSTLPLLRAEIRKQETPILVATFDLWRKIGGKRIPSEIRIQMPEDREELFIQYETDGVELNVEFPKDAFEQTVPPGTSVEELHCD